jgi:GWxTD domain-containing protein
VRVTAELLEKGRKSPIASRQQEARVHCLDLMSTQDSTLAEIYTLGLVAAEGAYRFRVVVEDLNVARTGFLYQMQKQRRQGEVAGAIDLGPWLFVEPALSGIEFAWAVRAATEESPFDRGPYEVIPQPAAHYGLMNDSLTVYHEIYDTPPPPEGRAYPIRTAIWSHTGDTMYVSVDSVRVREGRSWPRVLTFDLSAYPRGHYQIRLDILGGGGLPVSSTQSSFDVLWSPESWLPDAADFYEVAATTLLPGGDASGFQNLSRGEKEVLLEDLWRRYDPTPETAENEVRSTFRRRVEYANAHYTIFQRGMFTDRGRVWIRYGEPDDIEIERMPALDKDTIGHQLLDLPAEDREAITRTPRDESQAADLRPYEIWTYDQRGRELVPGSTLPGAMKGLKFVFVDEQGYGDYILRYSTGGATR